MNIQQMYSAIDVHVAGEAFRVIKDVPFMYYQSLDHLHEQISCGWIDEIQLLLNEPRGFTGLKGCVVVPSMHKEVDAAVLFFNHEGTIPLHYGGIVAVVTTLLESGQLKQRKSNQYKIETLRGIFSVTANMEKSEVVSVSLESKPCYVVEENLQLSTAFGNIPYSLIQADQLYAVFEKDEFFKEIRIENISELRRWGKAVLEALPSNLSIKRVVLVDTAQIKENRIKTITFQDNEYIVRSPGFESTMVSYLSYRSKKDVYREKPFINESIFNSFLTLQETNKVENGYTFTFTSRGFITGMQTFVLDPTDPFPVGFLLK